MSAADYLKRAAGPRVVAGLSEVRWPGRVAATVARRRGGRGSVELYIAFDDPYSALALRQIHARLEGRPAELVLYPMVDRGMEDDPADALRRRFAVQDSARLARRIDLTLSRSEPVEASTTAFLATWAESLRGSPQMNAFALAALTRIWFEDPATPSPEAFADLLPGPPPADPAIADRLAANTARMRRKGQWDSPAALVAGEWFFAHERIEAITERLDYLGWS